jgi:hypothetical protein
LVLVLAGSAGADVVTDWNAVAIDAVRAERTNPPIATRNLALLHTAVYDAVNGILATHEPYHVTAPAPAGASPEAAAAAAAHAVLSERYPGRTAEFDAALADSLGDIPDGQAKTDGIAWGETCAAAILELRADDGSDTLRPYSAPEGSGWWVPTPPAFAPALLPQWPFITPWTMRKGSQFRVPAPPPLTSNEYLRDFREVYRLGGATSTERTEDQSQIAVFWDDGPGTTTPPGHWQWIARILADAQATTLAENARMFALLSLVQADAAIVAWDNKYYYNNWRPSTGIHLADRDGRPETRPDTTWESFITTPPFPTYTSGHSTFSGGSARILRHALGTDDLSFSVGSDGVPGVLRSYTSLSEAGEEAGQSRIYGGIHWQYDNTWGLYSGRALADHVFYNFLRPLDLAVDACTADATTLCLNGGRFLVRAEWQDFQGNRDAANAVALSDDSGYFWFFEEDNTEVTVKVLDACSGGFDRYWVFASGLTNVEVTLTVVDTLAGEVRQYFNPLERSFEPILDSNAFDTCP